MASTFTPEKIKNLINQSRSAEPYSDDEILTLDGTPRDGDRQLATLAKITLEKYFALHPEDSIENYIKETA